MASQEFQTRVGKYADLALTQPVIITRNGRDRTVMISVEENKRLKRRDRRMLSVEDASAEEIKELLAALPPSIRIPAKLANSDPEPDAALQKAPDRGAFCKPRSQHRQWPAFTPPHWPGIRPPLTRITPRSTK